MTLHVHILSVFLCELPCDGHTDWLQHVAACFKLMWYNGDVKRHICSVSALNAVTLDGRMWNESIFVTYKVRSRISQQDLKKNTNKP
jgi:hypothetical protein